MAMNSVITTFCLIIIIAVMAPSPVGEVAYTGSVFDNIERDFISGDLSLDDKVILQITAIKNPADLPSKYYSLALGGAGVPPRGASMIIRDIRFFRS